MRLTIDLILWTGKMKKIISYFKNKFKRVYCTDCEHYIVCGDSLWDNRRCKKKPMTVEVNTGNLVERGDVIKKRYFELCKKVKKFSFCFGYEEKINEVSTRR